LLAIIITSSCYIEFFRINKYPSAISTQIAINTIKAVEE
jgi:hypothetical protein